MYEDLYWFMAFCIMSGLSFAFAFRLKHYEYFINVHLRKRQEYFDWDQKRKLM